MPIIITINFVHKLHVYYINIHISSVFLHSLNVAAVFTHTHFLQRQSIARWQTKKLKLPTLRPPHRPLALQPTVSRWLAREFCPPLLIFVPPSSAASHVLCSLGSVPFQTLIRPRWNGFETHWSRATRRAWGLHRLLP